ncbi:MAG TPA: class I SAM-dependent methyltransferase [Acidimicrobiales bacterium]
MATVGSRPGRAGELRARLRGVRGSLRLQGVPRRPAEVFPSLVALGQLRALGWQESLRTGRPVGADGRPRPWMPYAAVTVLAGLVGPETRVFEYGSGHSTVWLAARSHHVHTVEHDPDWFRRTLDMLGPDAAGADVRLVPTAGDRFDAPPGDAYVEAPTTAGGDRCYDVVVIDGMARRACAAAVGQVLAPGGVVVLDDTQRSAYQPAREALRAAGLTELAVSGPKPTTTATTTTSFFVRGR